MSVLSSIWQAWGPGSVLYVAGLGTWLCPLCGRSGDLPLSSMWQVWGPGSVLYVAGLGTWLCPLCGRSGDLALSSVWQVWGPGSVLCVAGLGTWLMQHVCSNLLCGAYWANIHVHVCPLKVCLVEYVLLSCALLNVSS